MSQAVSSAVHQIVLAVDIESFGDPRRSDAHRVVVRRGLYRALRRAFRDAGISWTDCRHEDRGDGVFSLGPAQMPKAPFVEFLPHTLARALRRHNETHLVEERIRLRMALHAGEVVYDEHGVVAACINHTFRLLDAQQLKSALTTSPGPLALITSGWFYAEVVRHSPIIDPSTYRPVEVAVKETFTQGWICTPGGAAIDGTW